MREIIFRGKRLDSGEWAEGNLVVKKDPFLEIDYCFILAQGKGDSFVTWHKVDPATVDQYTGLTDKNGKRIFEGDILKVHSGYFEGDTYLTKVWAEGATLCVFVQGEDYDYTAVNFADDLWSNTDYEPEVTGNIHDNPELIGGAEDG